jgi:hypothetical protein
MSDTEAIVRRLPLQPDCGFCWRGRDWPRPPRTMLERGSTRWRRGVRRLVISGEPTVYSSCRSRATRAAVRAVAPDEHNPNGQAGYTGTSSTPVSKASPSVPRRDHDLSDLLTRAPVPTSAPECRHSNESAPACVGLNCVVGRRNHRPTGDCRANRRGVSPLASRTLRSVLESIRGMIGRQRPRRARRGGGPPASGADTDRADPVQGSAPAVSRRACCATSEMVVPLSSAASP